MSMAVKYAVAKRSRMAQGGMAKSDAGEGCMDCGSGTCTEHGGDVVDRIMKRMSEGGVVANGGDTERADGEPAEFDDLVLDDHLEAGDPGSSETGDEQEDLDREDIVNRIMRSFGKTDRNPRPA